MTIKNEKLKVKNSYGPLTAGRYIAKSTIIKSINHK